MSKVNYKHTSMTLDLNIFYAIFCVSIVNFEHEFVSWAAK